MPRPGHRRRLAALLALLTALAALGAPNPALAAPAVLSDVEDEVMCPTCNVPLNVAESPQADHQRAFIRDLIADGRDKEAVKEALVAEYGEDVLALPQAEGFNVAVYVLPLLLVAGLAGVLVVLLPRWRGQAPSAAVAGPSPALSSADAARLDEDLRRFDRR